MMKAYLVGGPQDMVCMQVPEREVRLYFNHTALISYTVCGPADDVPIEVKQVCYRKIYESTGRDHFAVFVHDA